MSLIRRPASFAGQLRVPVRIEEATESNVDGVITITWSTKARAFVSLEPVSTRNMESFRESAVKAEASHVMRLRFVDGIAPRDRVVEENARTGTRTFDVLSVADIADRRHMLELIVQETV